MIRTGYPVKNGQTSVVRRVKLLDSTSKNGKTGLTGASTGLIISTIANNEATATAYTEAGSTIETIAVLGTFAAPTATKCRFAEVDATNHPGVYEVQIANARYAVASAKDLTLSISGVSGMDDYDEVIPLVSLDPYTATVNPGSGGIALSSFASGDLLTGMTNLSAAYAGLETGTAQAGGSATITLAADAVATNDYYKDQSVYIMSGTGAGQTNRITGYVGATTVATVETAWATQPDNTSVYLVLGRIG